MSSRLAQLKNAFVYLGAGALIGAAIVFVALKKAPPQSPATVPAVVSAQMQGALPPPVSPQNVGGGAEPAIPGRDIERWQSTSGYPVVVGRRAVDSGDVPSSMPEYAASTAYASQSVLASPLEHENLAEQQPWRIGRNGLYENPPVDPPSSHGAAYAR